MNWDAVGAIGEIIGAVAVIAALIYLAIQIREGARASRLDRYCYKRSEPFTGHEPLLETAKGFLPGRIHCLG
jgi:hypothetical protein